MRPLVALAYSVASSDPILSAVKDKLEQAARKMEDVDVRSRAITRKLNKVEELPSNPEPLLPELLASDDME